MSGKTWLPPWTLHQCGDKASDLGYPSSVCLDKKGNMMTAFYTDYEPAFKPNSGQYRVLVKRWNLFDWMNKRNPKVGLVRMYVNLRFIKQKGTVLPNDAFQVMQTFIKDICYS